MSKTLLKRLLGQRTVQLLKKVLRREEAPPAAPPALPAPPAPPAQLLVPFPMELLPLAMKYPQEAHDALAARIAAQHGAHYRLGENARPGIAPSRYPIPHDRMWDSPEEKVIRESSQTLIRLLDSYVHEDVGNYTVKLDKRYTTNYLYMNTARVANLVKAFRRKGFTSGRVLEVGAYFGSFALALQRLGYEVTAVDRYGIYGKAFDGYIELMKREGVKVVATTRETETDCIGQLPAHDAVIAMAVIEHVPHTPRFFLEMLRDRVEPGGLLALDTPNIARWWNRHRLAGRETIHQDLEVQYYCAPPYEGHHREYTGPEMDWMLRQVGAVDIELTYIDYNLFQFGELSPPHEECLLDFVCSPDLADTVLACGRIPAVRPG